MKISLIDHTGKGMSSRYAAELLIFTKSTRLQMSPDLFDDISKKDDEWIRNEIDYMSKTIPSSWEFCNYTFLIEGCNRAFTHQLVRNRHGSYAQQTMRVLNVSGFGYTTPDSLGDILNADKTYEKCMSEIQMAYDDLVEMGVPIEDSRGILPTNIETNIIASFNLRTCAELVAKRSSPRTQGMYRDFIEGIRSEILRVHPMFEPFLKNKKHDAASSLDQFIEDTVKEPSEKMRILKMVDLLRN